MESEKIEKNLRSKNYVVCADNRHAGGYCEGPYDTFDEAKDALEKHKKKTGHTDASVENDCPFGVAATAPDPHN